MPSNAENTTTIHLGGEQTARAIAETHRALAATLTQSTAAVTDCREMTNIDRTAVQFIESVRRRCVRNGKKLCMTSPPPEALRAILIRGGFLNAPSHALFWTAP